EGATLPIGEVIARIGDGGPNGGDPAAAAASAPSAEAPPLEVEEPDAPLAGTPGEHGAATAATQDAPPAAGERVKASPVARRIARERGVDIAAMTGTGPGGRIVKADVEAAAAPGAAPAAAPAEPAPAVAEPAPAAEPTPPVAAPSPGAADLTSVKGEVRVQELNRTQQVI